MRTYLVAVALGMVFDDGFKYMVLYRGGGGGGRGTITPPPSIAIFSPSNANSQVHTVLPVPTKNIPQSRVKSLYCTKNRAHTDNSKKVFFKISNAECN